MIRPELQMMSPPPQGLTAQIPSSGDASSRETEPGVVASRWGWVPIRSLGPRHRERIGNHLLSLDQNDRYLRFGYAATDVHISKYVDLIDFDRDEVFGVFNRRIELIAMAHLAHPQTTSLKGQALTSEFGVSVLARVRGRGFGRRLFEHAMLHARNRGVDTLFIHALSENTAMLDIARKAGAQVVREGSESEAWLKLPPDSFASHIGELVGQQAAELDYRIKLQTHLVNGIFGVFDRAHAFRVRATDVAPD